METEVVGGNPERASQLAEEVVAMLDTIKAVKGDAYAEAIITVFTLNNLIGVAVMDNTHMQSLAGIKLEQTKIMGIPTVSFVNMIVDCMAGLTAQLAVNFTPTYSGGDEYQTRLTDKAKEMMADIRMLLAKQDEYNAGGKGKV